MGNIAYIDGQNLYMGTAQCEPFWKVDLVRFRIYLEKKYHVDRAYYYIGYVQKTEVQERLYEHIQRAGFILVFKLHSESMIGKKKGNVDSDIIFSIMKRMYERDEFDKIVLVSGDGDYKMLVDFLMKEGRFAKILFPNRKYASSLYKQLSHVYFDNLGKDDIRMKIEKKKRGP